MVAAGRPRRAHISNQAWDASLPIPCEEWQVLQESHPNVLITGHMPAAARAIDALVPHLRAPVASWEPGQPLAVPQGWSGSLILYEPAALSHDQQRHLLAWLEAAPGGRQVVTASSYPLLTLAESGTFDVELYYRLNVIHLKAEV